LPAVNRFLSLPPFFHYLTIARIPPHPAGIRFFYQKSNSRLYTGLYVVDLYDKNTWRGSLLYSEVIAA
jgi:hypothetical protein